MSDNAINAGRWVAEPLYYGAGLAFLALAKMKHMLRGYSTPKPFSDVERCIEYDIGVAERYLSQADVAGKHVLELGPGADLGVGLYLLARGAASYTAVDRHPLAQGADHFYDPFIQRVAPQRAGEFRELLGRASLDEVGPLRYMVLEDFQFASRLPPASVDIVFSNAAFEHFDNVPGVLEQVRTILKPGGKLAATVDLQTHSRWIREKDPNNIYRYPGWLYRAFYFPGQPNRIRPVEYRRALQGWQDVRTIPGACFDSATRGVHAAFGGADAEMDVLTFVLVASR